MLPPVRGLFSVMRAVARTAAGRSRHLVGFHIVASRFFVAILAVFVWVGTARPSDAGYASIVIDAQTDEVLSQVNADTLNYPASLTKMMTLYIAFDAMKGGRMRLDERLPVSEHAAAQSPTKLGLRAGQTIAAIDAMLGVITKSANDAAVVIAEKIGGSEWEFSRMMTAKAAELGMTHTVFQNASGLPDLNQISSARDLARLSLALIRNHPEYYGYFATQAFSFEGRLIEGHNRFMNAYPGADGLKTGYIRASGFNLAGSAVRDGRRIVAVVLGGETAGWRDMHMATLMDRAFNADGSAAALVASAELPASTEEDGALVANAMTPLATPMPPAAAPKADYAVVRHVQTASFVPSGREVENMPDIEMVKRAMARSAPAPVEAPKGSWLIQVGVFSDKTSAQKIAQETLGLAGLPSSAKIGILPVKLSGKRLYRARLTGISRVAALEACKKLEKRKRDCMALDSDT